MIEIVKSVQSAIEIVGKLRELAKKIDSADAKMLLADLSDELGDTKLAAADMKIELAKLKEENTMLRATAEKRELSQPTLDDGVYRFGGDDGHYCTACFDVKRSKVRVKLLTGPFTAFGKWECPSCKATFG